MSLRAQLELLTGPPTAVVDGVAVTRAGREPGTAPVLLLVWAPVLAPLAARYHVVVVDLPGHGASVPLPPAADAGCPALAAILARVLARLGVEHPHVVGNSLGGWVALELAADGAAASVTGLAPAGLRLRPGEPSRVLRVNRAMARLSGPLGEALAANAAVRGLAFASGSARPAALDPGLARGITHALRTSTAYEAMIDATRHITFARGPQVQVPACVVFGDDDRILPAPENQQPGVAPPGARWVVLPRCGHAPMWDAPESTVELVDETVRAATSAAA